MSPLVAVDDGRRILVSADGPTLAACPSCESPMRAKRGAIVTWHWAHVPNPDYECAAEGETAWHLEWKNRAADINRIEVAVGHRRADVLTPYGWAVEFQHSPLSPGDVAARERDWGERMIWVYDGLAAYEATRLEAYKADDDQPYWTFRWAWHKHHVASAQVPTFIHVKPDRLLYVGKWYDKEDRRPLRGYGWDLSADEFTDHVINGIRPPQPPKFRQALNPQDWSSQSDYTTDIVPAQHGCGGSYCRVPGCLEYQKTTYGHEWNPNPLADIIAELGGKCADCSRFICECASRVKR